MSWRDREYARWTPDERRRFLGTTPSASSGSRSGGGKSTTTYGVALAAAVSLLLFGLGHFPTSHSIVPALHFSLPSGSTRSSVSISPLGLPARVQLRGPSVVRVGSFLSFRYRRAITGGS